ncbi:HDOD domain protein [Tepidimonas sediminis]|uniref:HDOD domain protein n=1 Tax=Tepidimonas sediminis TaxID=2588941 RepID=A0A554WL32_9BURK|nr:HDOD domain protein [Tepidimonas sediminis]
MAAAPLPVLLDDAALQAVLDEEATGHALAARLRADPPLGLRLIAAAQRHVRGGLRITHLEHALGLLGLGRAQALVRQAAARRFDPRAPGHLAYANAVATSLLAAHWAQACARIDGRGDHATVFWTTVLHGITHWHWALAQPARAEAWRARVAAGERGETLERAWLGRALADWDRALACHLGLADADDLPLAPVLDRRHLKRAARLAWTGANPATVEGELGRWLHQPALAPLLWFLLAREAMADWHGPRTALLLRALATLRGWRLDDTIAFAHRHAAEASRGLTWAVWDGAPAARLFWARPPARRLAVAAAEEVAAPATAAPMQTAAPQTPAPSAPTASAPAGAAPASAPAAPLSLDDFVEACQAQRFGTLTGFLQAFALTLRQSLGLARFALLMRTTDPGRLVCIAAHGFGAAVQPRRLQVPLAQAPLLARLMEQPGAFLRVAPGQVPTARAQLPAPLDGELPAGGVALATLTVRGRAAGILWADAGAWGQGLDDAQYQGIKRVTLHFARELTRLLVLQQRRADEAAAG